MRNAIMEATLAYRLAAVVSVGLAACGGDPSGSGTPPPDPVTGLTVDPPTLIIETGATSRLRATGRTASGKTATPSVQWSSDNQLIASVSQTGDVTGVGPGQTAITAQSGTLRAVAPVTVNPATVATVAVAPSDTTVLLGTSAQLRVEIRDSRGVVLSDRAVAWSSTDPTIATVSSGGLVSTLRPGTTTVTATCEGRTSNARIVVRERSVARVEILPDSTSLAVGSFLTPRLVLRDSLGNELTQRAAAWSSTDSGVVRVSTTGVVTGQAPGRARIMATIDGVAGSASFAVHLGTIAQLQLSSQVLSMVVGEARVVTVRALDAASQQIPDVVVTWTRSTPGAGPTSSAVEENPSSSQVISPTSFGVSNWTASAEGREATVRVFASSPSSGSITSYLARCPTAEEIAFVTAAVHSLDFQGDPGAPSTCQGSGTSLTQLQTRTYLVILMMASLRFSEPLPWTQASLFEWFSGEVQGIRFRADVSNSFCCQPAGVINIQTVNLGLASFPTFTATDAGIALALFIHEARHISYGGHTCGTKDNTVSELGAWGVQYHFYRLMGAALLGDGLTVQEKTSFSSFANQIRQGSICNPNGAPP